MPRVWLIVALTSGSVGSQSPCPVRDLGMASEDRPIAAVMVFTDPDDWYRDAQLISDVVLSGGVPHRKGPSPTGVGG